MNLQDTQLGTLTDKPCSRVSGLRNPKQRRRRSAGIGTSSAEAAQLFLAFLWGEFLRDFELQDGVEG